MRCFQGGIIVAIRRFNLFSFIYPVKEIYFEKLIKHNELKKHEKKVTMKQLQSTKKFAS